MNTWDGLEERFEKISSELGTFRLDEQNGSDGERWHIAGGFSNNETAEFKLLARAAGTLLIKCAANNFEFKDILDTHDPLKTWYRALKKFSKNYEIKFIATTKNDLGEETGLITSGSVSTPAKSSALLCMDFNQLFYKDRSQLEKFYDSFGKELLLIALGSLLTKLFDFLL